MEEFQFWLYFKMISLLFLISLGGLFIYVVVRAKELFFWSRSLSSEMKWLKNQLDSEVDGDKRAARIIYDHCQQLKSSFSVDIPALFDLRGYIHKIALCYHPESSTPELRVRVDVALNAIHGFSIRLGNILNRPLMSRFRKVRLRHVKQSYEYSTAIFNSPIFHIFQVIYKPFRYIFNLLRFILLDPFSILIYLSHKFGMLIVTRFVFLEIYLFIGREAMHVYGDVSSEGSDSSESSNISENVLKDLEEMSEEEILIDDPNIIKLRKKLFGLPKGLVFPPNHEALKSAIFKMTEMTAERYFPDAQNPLEEAAVGPLVDRLHHFICTIVKLKEYAVIRRLYHFRIETIIDLKEYASQIINSKMTGIARNALSLYKWTLWPRRLYRLSKRSSPIPIAIDLSWSMTKRASVYFFYKYLFDAAYPEIVHVYRASQSEAVKTNNEVSRAPEELDDDES